MVVLLFLLGLLLIVKGGDWFLDGAVWIAEASGVPRFIIGATVVSLATTLPELTVSITGVLENQVDMAVGNAVGSVTANLGLIMAISVICIPSVVNRRQFSFKAILMALAAVLLLVFCAAGSLPVLPSLILFIVFILFLANNILDARTSISGRREEQAGERRTVSHRQALYKLALFVLGIAAILIGSRLLINYGSKLALLLGVPASIIGVTLVAVGTSLPELVTTITAIARKEASLSIGNIIGANVIDLTMILPICSMVSGGKLAIAQQTTSLDLPACLTVCLVAVLPPLIKGKFYRWQGFALLGLYIAYLIRLIA